MAAVPHAAEVQRDQSERISEERHDPVPLVGVGKAAVDKTETRFAGLAPAQVVDAAAVHANETILRRRGNGLREPRRRSVVLLCHHTFVGGDWLAGLSMNRCVAQASRLRVRRASRSTKVQAARRRPNSQPWTAALRHAGSWPRCPFDVGGRSYP